MPEGSACCDAIGAKSSPLTCGQDPVHRTISNTSFIVHVGYGWLIPYYVISLDWQACVRIVLTLVYIYERVW